MTASPAITFVQYELPPLRSGELTITATQTVTAAGDRAEAFQAGRSLFVAGPRHTFEQALVDSVFPPSGSQGEFANVLAHVVLTSPTLPWQRSPSSGTGTPQPEGTPTATWLALLVFDEEDPPPPPVSATLAALAPTSTTFFPALESEPGEEPTDPITTIDVPVELFARIAPAAADLTWTAHVRQTAVAAKTATDGNARPTEVAVVVANRLPTAGRITTAHLVSLEGYGPHLPAANGTVPALPAGTTAVRLVTLRSWTFSAIDMHESFEGLLTKVDMSPASLQRPLAAAPTTDPAAARTVANAFGMGYLALDHDLRDGSATVSWYRGPLLPLATTQPRPPPTASSDELLRYDPGLGMLDVSYAAAWELGRLLALHDRAYATALYRWKLTITHGEAAALETELIDAALPERVAVAVNGERARPREDDWLVRVLTEIARPAAAALKAAGTTPAQAAPQQSGQAEPAAPAQAEPQPPAQAEPAAPAQAEPAPPAARAWPRLASGAIAARFAAPGPVPLTAEPAAGTDEAQVVDWLTRLHLLHGLPFGYLVPDPRMLPAESIRFFEVDTAWVAALLDGAFEVAHTVVAAGVDRAMRASVVPSVRRRLTGQRRRLLGEAGAPEQAPEAFSGFLLRSAVVSGWPGMEVHGFADAQGAQPLPIVRFEQVAPSVQLCLFAGALARVDLTEAPEGVHFGVDPGTAPATWRKQLRYADGGGTISVGQWIPGTGVDVPLRPPAAAGAVRLDDLARAMTPAVWAGPMPAHGFTAAEFALEMIEGVQAVSFRVQP